MATTENSRVLIFTLLCIFPALYGQENQNQDVLIRPLKSNGVIVSFKDIPMMNYFEFQGAINKQLEYGDSGDITIEVPKPKNGFWTGQDESVELKVGDVIYYYIHVGIKGQKGFDIKNLSYIVRELFDSNQLTPPSSTTMSVIDNRIPNTSTNAPPSRCGKTVTEIYSSSGPAKTVCSSQIIFEDNFDTLREDIWTVEQYIPLKPEYPFVSYQKSAVSVENGILRIEPQQQETLPGFDSEAIETSKLDLSVGCTRLGSCEYKSSGAQILPPIVSGRITSNIAFAFKYGFIEVRAKVPQGDWLYPDILLESLSKLYGAEDDRALRIAGVRGNILLNKGTEEHGNKILYGGPVMDVKCRNNLLAKKIASSEWGNDFHVYSASWAPEMITLFVDGEEWGRIKLAPSDIQARLPKDTCGMTRSLLETRMTTFNDSFGITLGVSAGGIAEFPDGAISGGTTSKPWKNTESKAKLNFYRAKNSWLNTWTQPALLVDYVRVRAL